MPAGFMVLTAFIQIVGVIDDLARGAFLLVPGLPSCSWLERRGCSNRQFGMLMPVVKAQ